MAKMPSPPPPPQSKGHDDSKPAHILFTCHPLTGHLTPALRIAAALRQRGWPVTFLGPTAHAARIAASGAHFLPLRGGDNVDLDDLRYYDPASPDPPCPGYHALPWHRRALVDLDKNMVTPIPAQWACVKDALVHLKNSQQQPVVIINEAGFLGTMPLYYGAPLPAGVPRPRTLCLSVTPPAIRSVDLPPFGHPLTFDATPAGRARNAACWARFAAATAPLAHKLGARLAAAGATSPWSPLEPVLAGANYTVHEAILQVGVPGFEYPRGDWPPHFRFLGFLPEADPPPGGYPNIPPWWDDVVAAAGKKTTAKHVVVVAQGTVETDPSDLILPTIEAMRGRDDVLVVAILGRKGATLPASFPLPANARVTDYLHYDAVLPHAGVWVHNGGYGAVTHGVAHGVPMVVAGEGQDKPENIRRVNYSGIGVGLATPKPGADEVRKGLEDVLGNDKYRTKVLHLKKETEELDCFGSVERAIWEGVTRE